MIVEKFTAGDKSSKAYFAISKMLDGYKPEETFSQMMRYRISGQSADECHDVYYVAHEDGKAVSRHWMGWGKHKEAVGNWGNFFTDEEYRGKGIGGQVLKAWHEDFKNTENLPLCFMCSASESLAKYYSRFGFVPAIDNAEYGPLYMPVGSSPKTFRKFTEWYYKPCENLFHKKASVGYRHEIDCLLRFALQNENTAFGIGETESIERALLHYPERAGMLFTPDGRCVGWSVDGIIQLYPVYEKSKIIDMR